MDLMKMLLEVPKNSKNKRHDYHDVVRVYKVLLRLV